MKEVKTKQIKEAKIEEIKKAAKDQHEYEQMLIEMLMQDFKGIL